MNRGQKCDHLGMITTTAIIILIQRHYDPHSWTLSKAHTLRKVIIIIISVQNIENLKKFSELFSLMK